MAPTSIFRRPGAQKFQLVHKSQRDLDRDPDLDQGVLKKLSDKKSSQPGQAANYGIYYDDRDYDYMQHLRTVGGEDAHGDLVESTMIPAPKPQDYKSAKRAALNFKNEELSINDVYDSQANIPLELQGFQPDMDPALRQTLEALDDDAYLFEDVQDDDVVTGDDDDDQFFNEIFEGGIREPGEIVDFGPDEEEDPAIVKRKERERDEYETAKSRGEDLSRFHSDDWMERFRQFKLESKAQGSPSASDSLPSDQPEEEIEEDDFRSEGGDTITSLRTGLGTARTRRKVKKSGSDASGYSMSSSSMFRNDGLQSLDARFDKIEEEYNSENDEDDEDEEELDFDPTSDLNVKSREDFDTILDEFLDKYEIVGGKMKQRLDGTTPTEKLNTMRLAMSDLAPKGEEIAKFEKDASSRLTSAARIAEGEEKDDESTLPMPYDIDEKEDKWDAETILSTYTNTENHPTKIRSQDLLKGGSSKRKHPRKVNNQVTIKEVEENEAPNKKLNTQIIVDPKTGFPIELNEVNNENDNEDESESEEDVPKKQTISRDRNESKDDKKARKQAAKQDKQNRRSEKKQTKQTYADERKNQINRDNNQNKQSNSMKL